MDKLILSKILKICIISLFIIAGYFLFLYTYPILLPILTVFLIASLIEPGVRLLHNKLRFPRPLASLTVLLFYLSALVGLIMLMITEIYEGIAYLAEMLPQQLHLFGSILEYYFHSTILPIYEQVFTLFNQLTASDQVLIEEYISNIFQHIASVVGLFFQELLFAIPQNLTVIPESLTVSFFILFASFLLSADFPGIKQFFNAYTPNKIGRKLNDILYYIKKYGFGYIKAQFILVAISFHLIFFGLLVIGVEHALTIALFLIIVDLIPYVGTGLLLIPWIGYSFLTGDFSLTIGLAFVYGIVIVTRQLVEPKILSMNMAIHPLAWLITAFIGMKIWGLFGLLLAPFIIVMIKGLHQAGVFQWIFHYINGKN